MPRFIDITGQRFGRLVALKIDRKDENRRIMYWLCQCDCGNKVSVRVDSLFKWNKTESCGCILRTHGNRRSKSYKSWSGMIQRCCNPKNANYKNWGGRGIKVCKRWFDFAKFFEDMGERPDNFSLDRIDVNGNYEPGNCRWATWKQQQNNRRNSRKRLIPQR